MYAVFNDIGRVTALYYNPVEEIREMSPGGVDVDELPTRENLEGFWPVLYVDLDTNELYYNYEALPVPIIPDEVLSDKVMNLESDLGNLLLENAADKATIATLEDTVGNLLLEVAALKGGAE
ncbi:hypothetical protein D3C77_647760 [compost metagenome]